MKHRLTWLILFAGLGLALVLAGRASAQSPTPVVTDDQVNAVAKQLYCPVCENIPLDVCPTQACIQWRELIREKLAAGWSADQIKQYFATQYGDRVLAQPPARGLNWLAYILPPLVLLIGIYLVYRALRGMRQQGLQIPSPVSSKGAQTGSAAESNDPYLARVEDELRRRQ